MKWRIKWKRSIDFEIYKQETINRNMKVYLVVRQFIIYHGPSSRAPCFQYSLGALKQITDSITCPFDSIALSMKENFTVTTFLFLFEISLRREEIRMSGVVGVVSGIGLLLLILQALGCVGDVWLVVEVAKCTSVCVVVQNLRAIHLLDEYTTWLALLRVWI